MPAASSPGQTRPRPFGERDRPIERTIGGLDLALAGAAIALIAFSVFTLGVTTQDDIAGDPYYYVIRQASTRWSASR